MAQKVISVVVSGGVEGGTVKEYTFPKVQTLLDEGYFIKEILSTPFQVGYATGTVNYSLTFVLDK